MLFNAISEGRWASELPREKIETQGLILVDCNAFYVSCERLFRPDLQGQPVVVLSNNDGCVVARSEEARQLGIKMGQPWFQIRDLGLRAFSSNYALYDALSQRVMAVLKATGFACEVYSIDEAFLAVPPVFLSDELGVWLTERVWRWTGIPVTVGMGYSKTQAKIASYLAKRVLKQSHYCFQRSDLARVPLTEIWGIGSRQAEKLQRVGANTAADFLNLNEGWIRQHLSVQGLRLLYELQGVVAWPLQTRGQRQQIRHARSFASEISALPDLQSCLSGFVEQAAAKLRRQGSRAGRLGVFVEGNRFRTPRARSGIAWLPLDPPTAYTPLLNQQAQRLLQGLAQPGQPYKKIGVILQRLSPTETQQFSWLSTPDPKQEQLMQTLDQLQRRYGRQSLCYARSLRPTLAWRKEQSSPRYLSSWQELPQI